MVRVCMALLAIIALVSSAFAQDAPAAVEAAANAASEAEAGEDEAEHVIVPGKPTRKMIYQFYQELASNDFCPRGLQTPRGYSCAEVTYEVLSASGESLGKCNIPIFRLYEYKFEYTAVTYEKLDCSKVPDGRRVGPIPLEELFNPTTRDGTIFRKISVMGIDQAKSLCEISKDICVIKLFDHETQLDFCSLRALWGMLPPPNSCAK